MCVFDEVFGKVRGVAISLKCIFVFIKSQYEVPYALLQSGHVILYIPDCAYLSDTCCFALVISGWYYRFAVRFLGRSF